MSKVKSFESVVSALVVTYTGEDDATLKRGKLVSEAVAANYSLVDIAEAIAVSRARRKNEGVLLSDADIAPYRKGVSKSVLSLYGFAYNVVQTYGAEWGFATTEPVVAAAFTATSRISMGRVTGALKDAVLDGVPTEKRAAHFTSVLRTAMNAYADSKTATSPAAPIVDPDTVGTSTDSSNMLDGDRVTILPALTVTELLRTLLAATSLELTAEEAELVAESASALVTFADSQTARAAA